MNKMKIRPLGNNLLIKPTQSDVKRESGLVLPESQQNQVFTGEVIAIGKAVLDNLDSPIDVGQKVAYAKYSGNEIGEHLLISEKDILGIIDEPD